MENMIIELANNYWWGLAVLILHGGASLYTAMTPTKDVWWYKVIEKVALVTGKAKEVASKTVKKGRK